MATNRRTARRTAPPPPEAPVVGYSIACTGAFRIWLRDLSARTLIPASVLSREALKEWAVARGHPAPPRR